MLISYGILFKLPCITIHENTSISINKLCSKIYNFIPNINIWLHGAYERKRNSVYSKQRPCE